VLANLEREAAEDKAKSVFSPFSFSFLRAKVEKRSRGLPLGSTKKKKQRQIATQLAAQQAAPVQRQLEPYSIDIVREKFVENPPHSRSQAQLAA
jgi:hypothetical protein